MPSPPPSRAKGRTLCTAAAALALLAGAAGLEAQAPWLQTRFDRVATISVINRTPSGQNLVNLILEPGKIVAAGGWEPVPGASYPHSFDVLNLRLQGTDAAERAELREIIDQCMRLAAIAQARLRRAAGPAARGAGSHPAQ